MANKKFKGKNLPKALYGDEYANKLKEIQSHAQLPFSGPVAKTNYNYYNPQNADDVLNNPVPNEYQFGEQENQRGFQFPNMKMKTPGFGNMVGGMIGMANMLLPGEDTNQQYHRRQYGSYNPYPQGTGSQGIYDDGGYMGPVRNRFRQEGKIKIQEEIPTNLGYGRETLPIPAPLFSNPANPNTVTPTPRPIPALPQNRSVQYDTVRGGMNDEFAPIYHGNWTPRAIQSFENASRDMMGGHNVVKGQALSEIQPILNRNPALYSPTTPAPGGVTFETIPMGNGKTMYSPKFPTDWSRSRINSYWQNVPQTMHGSPVLGGDAWWEMQNMKAGGKMKNCKDGGKFSGGGNLSVGQKIRLTAEEKAQYESQGYKFK